VEIRWCPAHKGVEGNVKADEWAGLAADEPDDHGVEWLTLDNRPRPMSRSASLAHLSRRIPVTKWEEAKDWCYGPPEAPRIDNPSYATKCKRWRKNCPDPMPAKAPKRLASRFYQMKTGHALTGKYLKHICSRESDACWWCGQPGASKTREHLFKSCPAWRQQQKVLWKESPEANQEGPRPFPDGGPLHVRALLQGGAAVPRDDRSRQDRAEGEVDGRGQRCISSGQCIGT